MDEIVRLENAVKMIEGNRRVLSGVSLCIHDKQRVAVCGPPGSGKDALMRLVAGMETPSAGSVYVLGQDMCSLSADQAAEFRNKNIGIIRRRVGFIAQLDVLDNVSMPLAVRGISAAKRRRAAKELLKDLGTAYIAHAHPAQLSAYQTLLASVARALIAQSKILMMYEAAAGLSEREAEQFTGTMNAISKYGDYTVLSFSVDPINGLRTDRTVILNYGRIREDKS